MGDSLPRSLPRQVDAEGRRLSPSASLSLLLVVHQSVTRLITGFQTGPHESSRYNLERVRLEGRGKSRSNLPVCGLPLYPTFVDLSGRLPHVCLIWDPSISLMHKKVCNRVCIKDRKSVVARLDRIRDCY